MGQGRTDLPVAFDSLGDVVLLPHPHRLVRLRISHLQEVALLADSDTSHRQLLTHLQEESLHCSAILYSSLGLDLNLDFFCN